ncbi:MAG: HupE/UreJ family protein [Paracoccaceae bacterium]
MTMLCRIATAVALLMSLLSTAALSHEARPLYVEITEVADGAFRVLWKAPLTVGAGNIPIVRAMNGCTSVGQSVGGGNIRQQDILCRGQSNTPALEFEYPKQNPSISTMIHFARISGETHTKILPPDMRKWTAPAPETAVGISRDYIELGFRHILEGFDHLLFVTCLLLIAGTFRRILITITGFTLAHSITLAAGALGLARVPIAPVEATIALSIVFLAYELVRNQRDTLTWRYPILVSGGFGLLHGFGFASVISEIGLPQTEVAAALVAFNIGVEVGQVLFVILIVIAVKVAKTSVGRNGTSGALSFGGTSQRIIGYAVGTTASFWTLERVAGYLA